MHEVISARHAVWVSSVADGRGVPLTKKVPISTARPGRLMGSGSPTNVCKETNWELSRYHPGGGKPVRLAEAAPGGGDHTAWSPTGEWIAHVREGALRLTSAADGQTQKALSGSPPVAFGFSLDG